MFLLTHHFYYRNQWLMIEVTTLLHYSLTSNYIILALKYAIFNAISIIQNQIIATIITIQFCHSLPRACSFQFAIFCRQISNTNTKVAVQYQHSPPPRLNGVLQNLHWRFRQKVWEFFCPNFNGRPPTGTTSQSHSLDSEDEEEEENNIFQAQDDSLFDSLFW